MEKASLEIVRHSASHLMAAAVLELFPKAKFGIGPVIENGFYYDFDLGQTLTPRDLVKIENKMGQMAKRNLKFEKKEMSIGQAIELFQKINQPYKIELLKEIEKYGTTQESLKHKNIKTLKQDKVTVYQLGNFIDLCRGPHVGFTSQLGVFKLNKIAGAYWRGNEKNKMLQRIYGLAFVKQTELNNFLKLQEEAEKRDHRKIGQELGLFSIDEEVGPGLILWHPKGALLVRIIEDFWIKEHLANGYQLVKTPHIGCIKLWQTSGHTGFYKENMFGPMEVEGSEYLIKPMNCPFAMKIYKSQARSYRDLPVRWGELGTVYRYERSGVLHGLTRVRGFTQDDAHIICTPEQLSDEIMKAVRFGVKLLKTFGFKDYNVYLATQPEKYVGAVKDWEKAVKTLKYVLDKLKLKYEVDSGGGVFYGPKIDIKIKDSLGREWQCTTVQFDFNLPERFAMTYADKDGKKKQPFMVHRALLGSLERFIGVLIEHYAGAFPVWLSPVQVYLTPVGKAHQASVKKIAKELEQNNLRVETDFSNETISYKVRKAEKQKIPYILVIGDKEAKAKILNVRIRGNKVEKMTRKKFLEKVLKEIEGKK